MKRVIFLLTLAIISASLLSCGRGAEPSVDSAYSEQDESDAILPSNPDTGVGTTAAETDEATTFPSPSTVSFSWSDGRKTVIKGSSWAPRVFSSEQGKLIAGYETSSGIKTAISTNNGRNWTAEAAASFRPDKTCANVNFFAFDGRLYMAYRAIGDQDDGFYTSLQVSVSEDSGRSWRHHSTICEYLETSHKTKGVWEPCLGEIDGSLVCFYANDHPSVTSMQNIESLTWDGVAWTNRTVICDGRSHNSRDGMPVWIRLNSGGYAMVIESSHERNSGHPFVIRLLLSDDGKKWSEPKTVYVPTTSGSKAGAPGIVELPTGQLVISFQTDEDATKKGDSTSVMKTIISDGTEYRKLTTASFSPSDNVFGTPDGEHSTWTGIRYGEGYLYAAAGTRSGSSLNAIKIIS